MTHIINERLEQQRWDKHQADMDKDDWISKRTDELSKEWPGTVEDFKNPFLSLGKFSQAMAAQQAVDAYENMIWEICLVQATKEWSESWMLGEVA